MKPHWLALALGIGAVSLASRAAALPGPSASTAAAPPPDTGSGPRVVAPGQDELLLAMLGGQDSLAGCHLAGARPERDVVRATYDCPGGQQAELTLRHPRAPGPEPEARSAQFVLVSRGAPPALVEALARRLREREAGFRWISPMEAPRRPPEQEPRPAPPPARPAPAPPWRRFWGVLLLPLLPQLRAENAGRQALGALAFGLAAFSLVHGLLGCLGDVVVGGAYRHGLLVAGAGALAAVAAALLGGMRAGWRSAAPAGRLRLLAAGAAIAAAAMSAGGERREAIPGPASFGNVLALRPGRESVDDTPGRPETRYTTNQRGFRGPDFADDVPPAVTRVALVGDSYVFGSGLGWEDTIGEALRAELGRRAPGRAFDIVNLGIPGDNLGSHVEVYAEAAARLHPAVVVLFLTLPNDLSAFDDQAWRKEAARWPSGLVRWALGAPLAGLLWHAGRLESSFSPAALGVLARETDRLAALRGGPSPPSLLVYSYFGGPPEVLARLRTLPGARVLPAVPSEAAQWLPGDGHPTGQGNRAFAAPIAAAIAGL